MAERICLKIAAGMFGGDPGLLDSDLVDVLERIDDLIERNQHAYGLLNREVIAIAIINWQYRNPDRSPYHY